MKPSDYTDPQLGQPQPARAKAKIVAQTQSQITFELYTEQPVQDSELSQYQREAGKDPAGYGNPANITRKQLDSAAGVPVVYKVRWTCWGSCD